MEMKRDGRRVNRLSGQEDGRSARSERRVDGRIVAVNDGDRQVRRCFSRFGEVESHHGCSTHGRRLSADRDKHLQVHGPIVVIVSDDRTGRRNVGCDVRGEMRVNRVSRVMRRRVIVRMRVHERHCHGRYLDGD